MNSLPSDGSLSIELFIYRFNKIVRIIICSNCFFCDNCIFLLCWLLFVVVNAVEEREPLKKPSYLTRKIYIYIYGRNVLEIDISLRICQYRRSLSYTSCDFPSQSLVELDIEGNIDVFGNWENS